MLPRRLPDPMGYSCMGLPGHRSHAKQRRGRVAWREEKKEVWEVGGKSGKGD